MPIHAPNAGKHHFVILAKACCHYSPKDLPTATNFRLKLVGHYPIEKALWRLLNKALVKGTGTEWAM